MHYGKLAGTGASFSLLGIAFGQIWIPALVLVIVGATAFIVRARFRRGQTPGGR